MHIKEFPKITKEGKEKVERTNMHEMIGDFTRQLYERGFTSLVFFTDKIGEYYGDYSDDVVEMEEMPSGLSYTEDFNHEDMMTMIMGYMDSCMNTKSKLAFATQLHNYILNEVIDDSTMGGSVGYEDEEPI